MAPFRWIKMFLFWILMILFRASTGQTLSGITVRVGDEATLPCENKRDDQQNCDSTTWLLSKRDTAAVTLIKLGQIEESIKTTSERLSITEDCSLVIKKVGAEDIAHYTCKQSKSEREVSDFVVLLSIVEITEYENNDRVVFYCSVFSYDQCSHRVEWLYEGTDNIPSYAPKSGSSCDNEATVEFNEKSKFYEFLKCKVTDREKEQLFSVRPQPSDDTTAIATINSWTTSLNMRTSNPLTSSIIPNFPFTLRDIVVSVGLAALTVFVVTVVIWTKVKGTTTQTEEDTGGQ